MAETPQDPSVKTIDLLNIQQLVQDYVTKKYSNGVGVVVGLIENGNVHYYSSGKKAIDGNELVHEDTVFEIGSITKVFTTLVLITMVQDGLVSLDDPVEKYIPSLCIPQKNGKKITLRHLATHTSGLPRDPTNLAVKNGLYAYDGYTIEQLYACVGSYECTREPGVLYEYSNVGMGLLGHILCLRAGQSYEQLIQERICTKLGMTKTFVTLPAEVSASMARGHCLLKKVKQSDMSAVPGAAGLYSTVKDMVQFLAAHMSIYEELGSVGDSVESGLLKKAMSDSLVEQCVVNPTLKMALGWMIFQKNDDSVIWHKGAIVGYSSFIGFNRVHRTGVVILTNSADRFCDKLGYYICRLDKIF